MAFLFIYNMQMNIIKSARLLEVFISLIIVFVLTAILFFKYINFADYAILTEGKTSASNIAQMLELYYLSHGKYKQIENISYDKYLDVDLRNNVYFKEFSIFVPGNYKNSIYSIKLSTIKNIKEIEITLHILKYQQKLFEIRVGDKVKFY